MSEELLEQERFKRQLISTSRSLKKKQQQLQADQDLLNDRWAKVLVTKEYGLSSLAKGYPKHRLLYQSDEEAFEPTPSSHNAAGHRQLCLDKEATQAEHQTAPPRRKGKNTAAHDCPDDLQRDLDSRAGHARPIYGSRMHTSTRDDSYLFGHDRPSHAQAENRKWTPSELRRSVAQHRGAAHPLCFTDEVMDHEFPEGFKTCQY